MEVFTIPLPVAIEWLQGHAGETELLAARDTSRDVVFIFRLESREDYAALRLRCGELYDAGARGLCARSENPIILAHVKKLGGHCFPERDTRFQRFVLLPASFKRWATVSKNSPPLPG